MYRRGFFFHMHVGSSGCCLLLLLLLFFVCWSFGNMLFVLCFFCSYKNIRFVDLGYLNSFFFVCSCYLFDAVVLILAVVVSSAQRG